MPRQRLGVALLVPGSAAVEIDGLRRALGDGALGRIPAHLTLVPPVNVSEDRLPDALAVLRDAATRVGPLHLVLGPAATFHPVTPVVYLAVAGDLDGLRLLRDAVFHPPLARHLTHPFVPHVTLADDMAPDRIPAALAALADARLEVTVDRVHLLREERGRVWYPIADAPLAPQVVVGRGGLPLAITVSSVPDPEAAHLLASPAGPAAADRGPGGSAAADRGPGGPTSGFGGAAGSAGTRGVGAGEVQVGGPVSGRDEVRGGGTGPLAGPVSMSWAPLAVAARRDGELVGAAQGWTVGPLTRLALVVVAEGSRRQGVGGHVLAAVEREARDRGSGALDTVAPDGPAVTGLLSRAGWSPAGEVVTGWRWWRRLLAPL